MEGFTFLDFIVALAILIISVVVLVKYFRLCKDVRIIRSVVEDNWGRSPEPEPIIEHHGKGTISPTKSDVREFQDRIKEYKKTHKDIDQQWIENLIIEYNNKFSEDFHQYL